MKEGCTNKKSREKKRGEREILINPVHRENGQERREKAKAWLDKAETQLVNKVSKPWDPVTFSLILVNC